VPIPIRLQVAHESASHQPSMTSDVDRSKPHQVSSVLAISIDVKPRGVWRLDLPRCVCAAPLVLVVVLIDHELRCAKPDLAVSKWWTKGTFSLSHSWKSRERAKRRVRER